MTMEIRHLKYFVAVAEELHFGNAAQRLHIAQPSLSLQIKALERDLGVQLFERNRHKVRLSASGEAALGEAYRLLEQAERVRSSVLHAHKAQVARLSIGCVQSALFDLLPPILDRLHVTHPEIRLSLTDFETASAVPALLQGRIDAGLLRVDRVQAPIKTRRLMRDHFIAALPERHKLAGRARIPLEELAGEPLVIFSREISPRPHDAVIAACLKAGFHANIQYQAGSIQSQLGLAACGVGIALVPSHAREWRVPRVVYRELGSPVVHATDLSLAWNEDTRSPAVDAFLKTVEQVMPKLRSKA
jgi:DNA-binding transcriptional LysR family regulator